MISIAPIGKPRENSPVENAFFFPTSFTLVHSCARLALRVRPLSGLREGKKELI